ncbi:hypothetical protein [Sphingomonas crusticola]|uniref:hypothetical protein n=1 Tax=Sphingomonas crusticola TaxID=1697973 RepID=UPI0013C2A461|nr:hypothetical protein [Sphingomonas crusticola]
MSNSSKPVRPVPSFAARLLEALAVTDRFVDWWGAHRAWPATECARIDRCR